MIKELLELHPMDFVAVMMVIMMMELMSTAKVDEYLFFVYANILWYYNY